ncbi:MAG: hypothetical protein J6R46_00410, partial [Clostridia bacterium]|nr:hypothetical protein [Clostridia bacterium]
PRASLTFPCKTDNATINARRASAGVSLWAGNSIQSIFTQSRFFWSTFCHFPIDYIENICYNDMIV